MKRRLPPLNSIRAFEAAARLGRMSAAADELAVTPGAVSRQVALLEETLGVQLFAGSRTRPELTEAGAALLPRLTAALDMIEEATRDARRGAAATLDVSCLSTFSLRWLIPRLHRFQALHPEITVRLNATAETVDIDRERFDVVIGVEQGEVQPGDLFAETLGPVLAPSLATGISLVRPEDLTSLHRLSTRTRRDAWPLWSEAVGISIEGGTSSEFQHYYYTLEAAVAGLGVAIAPRHLVTDDIQAGRLLAPLGFLPSGYRYTARRRPGAPAAASHFCDWLLHEATG